MLLAELTPKWSHARGGRQTGLNPNVWILHAKDSR
jgi:hypothetical protein